KIAQLGGSALRSLEMMGSEKEPIVPMNRQMLHDHPFQQLRSEQTTCERKIRRRHLTSAEQREAPNQLARAAGEIKSVVSVRSVVTNSRVAGVGAMCRVAWTRTGPNLRKSISPTDFFEIQSRKLRQIRP